MQARMVQDGDGLTYGVIRLRFVLLVAIATHTGKRKIVGSRQAAFGDGVNMIGSKGINAEVCRTAAVFAASSGTADNLCAEPLRHVFRQRQEP